MLTPEECVLAEAISDRLIELYVRRDEACREDNWQDAHQLQDQIEEICKRQRIGVLLKVC